MDLIDAGMRDRLMDAWIRALDERFDDCRRCGPPNWLVKEEAGGSDDWEKLAEAHLRLRGEYGLDKPKNVTPDGAKAGNVTQDVTQEADVTPDVTPGICVCGKPVRPRGKQCWACAKRATR